MPIYSVVCPENHRDQIWSKIDERDKPRYCRCGGLFTRVIDKPYVAPEIQAYVSPVTGEWVNSRAQRKEDLKRSNSLEYEPGMKQDLERRRKELQEEAFKPIAESIDREVTAMHACNLI